MVQTHLCIGKILLVACKSVSSVFSTTCSLQTVATSFAPLSIFYSCLDVFPNVGYLIPSSVLTPVTFFRPTRTPANLLFCDCNEIHAKFQTPFSPYETIPSCTTFMCDSQGPNHCRHRKSNHVIKCCHDTSLRDFWEVLHKPPERAPPETCSWDSTGDELPIHVMPSVQQLRIGCRRFFGKQTTIVNFIAKSNN